MSVPVPKLLVEQIVRFAEELNSDSKFNPLAKDLNLEFQKLYENKEFLDFEIKTTSSKDSIRVHRLYLIIRGFRGLVKCQSMITIDANKDLVKSVIDFYYHNFDLKIDGNNVGEYMKIADQLGNEELYDYLDKRGQELILTECYHKLNVFKSSVKRKSSVCESLPRKVFKSSDSSSANGLTPIPEINDSTINSTIDSVNTLDSSVICNKNVTKTEDKRINDNSDTDCDQRSEKSAVDENEDNCKQKKTSLPAVPNETADQRIQRLTTIITGFIPDSDESSDNTPIKHKSVSDLTKEETDEEIECLSSYRNATNGSEYSADKGVSVLANKLSERHSSSVGQRFDYTKLLKNIQNQKTTLQNNQMLIRSMSRDLRRKTTQTLDPIIKETAESVAIDYSITKFVSHSPKSESTQVWRSRFVPKISNEEQLVAVVGGSLVNWFNLDQMETMSKQPTEPTHVFNSPNDLKLRSIAVCVIHDPIDAIIYAIGSVGCVFILKHPEKKNAVTYDTISGIVGRKEDVTDLVFNVRHDSVLLFLCTSDKKIILCVLKFEASGRLKTEGLPHRELYSTTFPLLSIVYIENYDCLVASGESHDLIVLKGVSSFDQKPIVGKLTPKMDLICISSLIYIEKYDLIGFRSVNTDYLQLAQMDKIMSKFESSKQFGDKPILLPFSSGAKLQYRKSQIGSEKIEFIEMTANAGLIACGDAFGNVFVYACNTLLKGKGLIKPIQLIGYSNWKNSPPIIRSVAISDDLRYIVSTTNTNLIAICRPSPPISK